MNRTDIVLSRKHISSGRTEILYRDHSGELRLGRVFSTEASNETVLKVLEALKTIDSNSTLVPDRLDFHKEDKKYCFSMPWDTSWDSPVTSNPKELISLLDALHRKGWLHLDITPGSYRIIDGCMKLLVWGDAFISGLASVPPELAAGAAPIPLTDYYILGRAMMAAKGTLWDGSNSTSVESLVSVQTSRRARALSKISSIKKDVFPGKLKQNTINVLAGGNWKERDTAVAEWVTKASADGWLVSVIRCNPMEIMRPLPGRESPEEPIKSGAALLRCIFPSMSGVERLLVIDQVDFASVDLLDKIVEFTRLLPPGLTVLLTAAEIPAKLQNCALQVIKLGGESTLAWDIPFNLPSKKPEFTGYPFSGYQGPSYRDTGLGDPPDRIAIPPGTLFSEGGYRALISMTTLSVTDIDQNLIARAHFEIGNCDEALHFAHSDNILLRAKILLTMGRPEEASELLADDRTDEGKILLASARLDLMDPEGAVDLLRDVSGAKSALLQAKALDLQGRIAEALPMISGALENTTDQNRVKLLCSMAVIFMRTGDYRNALETAGKSVSSANKLADASLLGKSLTERGRVREVTGNWSGAVDDYRLALLYYAENPGKTDRPPLIDLFVLELRTGELNSAERTFKSLAIQLNRSGRGIPADQMTSMLTAYRGVLLGLGSMRIPSARRSAAMAAEKKLTLVHALSLLYLGQLLLQEGRHEEGLEALKHARAEAGLMGDRHLALLADLAMTRTGTEIDTSRMLWEARELGLKPEELEAEVISTDDPQTKNRAFLDILNMPAPLLACELASSFGLPEDPGIRRRILESFRNISELLDSSEKEQFIRFNNRLARIQSSSSNFSDVPLLTNSIKTLAEWITNSESESGDLNLISDKLGLTYLGTQSEGARGEMRIHTSPDIFAAGPDLSAVKLLAPIIAVASEARPSPKIGTNTHDKDLFPEITGTSDALTKLKSTMKRVAHLPVPVLITGDTGTGKELVARGLHSHGARPDGPFITVDCGAISEALLESELFGVTRGAYTGASENRIGLMEAANGGTLFLDEIGNMSTGLQVKLLRVLETRKLRRLGDTSERETAFRLLTATNADLKHETTKGTFRLDLYYRIAVINLKVPALKDRIDDIPLLVERFSSELRGDIQFSREALTLLLKHSWPGNIRELKNVVQRTVLLSEGNIVRASDVSIGDDSKAQSESSTHIESLEAAMCRHVSAVVNACEGNRLKASRVLQCDPKTVRKYLAAGHQQDD